MNSELSKIFSEMATLLDMKKVAFKPRAFEKAAESLSTLDEDVKVIYERDGLGGLEKIPGVGAGIASRIEEYIQTGEIKDYEKLKKQIPVNLEDFSNLEGVGPSTILKLYKKLHITEKEQLEKAIREGKLRDIKGFGEKTEQRILKSIEFIKADNGRLLLGDVLPYVKKIVARLEKVKGVKKVAYAGSIRRMQETIGDIDLVVTADDSGPVMEAFVKIPGVQEVTVRGDTKSTVRLKIGIDADLRVVAPESFGAVLQYFTGDKYHNIKVREMASEKGYKLNEYGLFLEEASSKKQEARVVGKTEEEIYEALGMQYIEPELRTNHGEIEAALENKIPKVIGYGDLKGDLQVQTNWTDGKDSIEKMAEEAQKMGLEYICITDHTKALAMTGGSDEKRLLEQMEAIDKINSNLKSQISKFKILKGAEVNIMKDGSLDIDDETLAKLDVVGAAIHSLFHLSEEEQTNRLVKAMENPNVDIIFHPTGRKIQNRPPYKLNMDEILKVAKRTKTVLEIDAYPDRLDLKDEYIRKAIEMGIKLSIDSDAHSAGHFKFLEYGIGQARRGWATRADIINVHSWEAMLKMLK